MPRVSPEHLAARRQQILDAARRCFSENGFHATTIEDIRTEAGISAGLIYRYFSSKDDVVEAFFDEADRRVDTLIVDALGDDDDALADLRRVLDRFLETFAGKECLEESRLAVQFWAEAAHSPGVRRTEARRLRRMARPLARIVERGQDQGSVRRDLPALSIAHVFLGGVQAMILRAALFPARERNEFRDVSRAALIDGILAPRTKEKNR